MASYDAESGASAGPPPPADVLGFQELPTTSTSTKGLGPLRPAPPPLAAYGVEASWAVYAGGFALTAARVGLANLLTQGGMVEESGMLSTLLLAFRTSGVMFAISATVVFGLGIKRKNLIAWGLTTAVSILYGFAYGVNPQLAPVAMLLVLLLVFAIGIPFSKRRLFAVSTSGSMLICQGLLTFIIQSITLVQRRLPEASQQFLVPVVRTMYLGAVTEGMSCVWRKTYRKPAPPFLLTVILFGALASTETMGVVGLLTAVDSNNIWENAVIFCATTVVMETNSRSGILISGLYKLMGKQYCFSDAAQVFRWGKMWASYGWICAFASWVVPALLNELVVKDSKFSFLRWEPWALLGMYLGQQITTDAIFVCIQHYLRPSASLSQTASRCLILGEATPFFAIQRPASGEGADCVGKEAMIVHAVLFETCVSVWNNYTRGHFGLCGTFMPGWESGEAC